MSDRPITAADFRRLVEALGEVGSDDIAWAEALCPPTDAADFAQEIIFVICNSGMKNTVARGIYERVMAALEAGRSASTAFRHVGKATAIDRIWRERESLLSAFTHASDKLEFCRGLPWIGKITCYHVAKNFGADVAKPDIHLQRLADRAGVTPQALCEALARETGYRIATVDTILWRACANGLLNSRTGEMRGAA